MIKLKTDVDSQTLCDAIVEGMQDNKAKNIVVLDLREISSVLGGFIFDPEEFDSTGNIVFN